MDCQNNNDWKLDLRSKLIKGISFYGAEKVQAINQVGYYYKCYAPASLYKYYPDKEMHLNAITDKKMWYSAPSNFNDIFDCSISIDENQIFQDVLKMYPNARGIRPGSQQWKVLREEVHRGISELRSKFEDLRAQMGVACLSESYDSLLMWAHYANNHCGMCVEYELLELNKQLGYSPIPIVYSNERACFRTFNPGFDKNDIVKLCLEALTSKSIEWSYEKEWRIVQDQTACGEKWNPENKGALLDMIRPTSITLGCKVKSEFEEKVKGDCRSNKINLYKMEQDILHYQLNRKPIMEF